MWQNTEIAPSTAGVDVAIDILIIAIVGGVTRPIGPFIGALIYAILKAFALDFLVAIGLNGARFRMLIGFGVSSPLFSFRRTASLVCGRGCASGRASLAILLGGQGSHHG